MQFLCSSGQRSIIWLQTAPDSSSIAPSLNQIPQQHSQKQELIGKVRKLWFCKIRVEIHPCKAGLRTSQYLWSIRRENTIWHWMLEPLLGQWKTLKLSHATRALKWQLDRLVSNFVLLSLGSGNGTLQQEKRTTKVEDRLVASLESDSVADTTDLPSSPFPSARWGDSCSSDYGCCATWCFGEYEARVGEREGRAGFAWLLCRLMAWVWGCLWLLLAWKIAGERGRHRGQGEWLESRRRFFLRSLFRIWSGSGCFDSAWLAGTSAGERRSLPFRRRSVIQLGRVSTAPQSKPTSYTERTNSGSARALLSSKKRTAPSRIGRDAGPESASSLLVEKYYSLVGEPFAREESARAAQRWEEEAWYPLVSVVGVAHCSPKSSERESSCFSLDKEAI